jgi:hypothetical protein
MHTIFIHVLDVNGAPLDGVVVGDTWNNVEEVSGHKGLGRTEINLWSNTMDHTPPANQCLSALRSYWSNNSYLGYNPVGSGKNYGV